MLGAFRRPRAARIDMRQCTTAPDGGDLAAAGGPLADAVLVGGAVRDLLLGRALVDLDWLVPDPDRRAEALAAALAGSVVRLDPERGHWRVAAAGRTWDLIAPGSDVRVPTGDAPPPAPPDLASASTTLDPLALEHDLRRRDLTINALAALPDGRVVDPTGGLRDLAGRCIRLTGPEVLEADPLRAWRAVRFAAQLGFRLDDDSARQIAALAAGFRGGSRPLPAPERLQSELRGCLESDVAGRAMAALDDLGLLEPVLPELTAGRGVRQGGLHHMDVLHHQLEALQRLVDGFPAADLALRWATLLHDVGKPPTCRLDEGGRPRFHGHDAAGALLATRALRRLRVPGVIVTRATALVRAHMRPLPHGERAARRFVHRLRPLLPDLLRLMVADREAARGPQATEAGRRRYRLALADVIRRLEAEPASPAPLLDGHALMATLGLAPGPAVGAALRALEEARAVGDVRDRAEAEAYLRGMAAAQGWPIGQVAPAGGDAAAPGSDEPDGRAGGT
jgi:poly(A) polymerase